MTTPEEHAKNTALDEMRGATAFRLANDADCACPDELDSAGARFLLSVLRDTCYRADEIEPEGWEDLTERLDDDLHEIADSAPDVYTYTRWLEFVDLAAWQEDPTELTGNAGDNMTEMAGVCLYIIAERLARSILDQLAELYAEALSELTAV